MQMYVRFLDADGKLIYLCAREAGDKATLLKEAKRDFMNATGFEYSMDEVKVEAEPF